MTAVLDFSETEKIRSLTSSFLAALDGSIASEVFPRSMIDVRMQLIFFFFFSFCFCVFDFFFRCYNICMD